MMFVGTAGSMLTREQNPPLQSPEDRQIEAFDGRWWVAHTKPRQEKALARDVWHSGGQYFLPMHEVTRTSRGRKWKTWLPLFTGYAFLCCDEAGRVDALQTDRIANLIEVPDQQQLVDELASLRRLLDQPGEIDPYPKLCQGKLCRIRKGPLVGLEGIIERRRGRTRFVVNVTVLGQAAAVEIDADALEVVD